MCDDAKAQVKVISIVMNPYRADVFESVEVICKDDVSRTGSRMFLLSVGDQ